MWSNPQQTGDFVIFIEETFTGKLHFLCGVLFKIRPCFSLTYTEVFCINSELPNQISHCETVGMDGFYFLFPGILIPYVLSFRIPVLSRTTKEFGNQCIWDHSNQCQKKEQETSVFETFLINVRRKY